MSRANGHNSGGAREEQGIVVSPRSLSDQDDTRLGAIRVAREERGGRLVSVQKLSGNREGITLESLVPERAAPKLRSFVDTLGDRGVLTAEQREYFDLTINQLETLLPQHADVNQGTSLVVWQYLVEVNPLRRDPPQLVEADALEQKVVDAYRSQLLSTIAILEGFDHANTNDAQKLALLGYANYFVNRVGGDVSLENLKQQLVAKGIDITALAPVEQAFDRVGLDVGVTFDDFASPMLRDDAVTMDGGHLVPEEVDGYLAERAGKCYEDLRGLVKSIDGLATEQELADRAKHPRSELLGISRENPFRDWEDMVREKNGGELKVVDAMLGEEKQVRGFLGIPEAYERNKHEIKNYKLFGPVTQADGRQRREEFQGMQATFKGRVWRGEAQRGSEIRLGEVITDKEFFAGLVEVPLFGIKVARREDADNALLQIQAARVVELEHSIKPSEPGKFLADLSDEELDRAEAFMMPIIGPEGKPIFAVMRKAELVKLHECVKKSQASFAKFAAVDKVYAEKPWAERAREFDMPQKSFETTYANWVDELRDVGKVEDLADEITRKLRTENPSQASIYEAAQIEDAVGSYTEHFAEFEAGYCRLSNYRQEAAERLISRGYTKDGSRGWSEALDREVKAVALEYMYKAQAYKNLTARVLDMRDGKQLRGLLTNIDYELEITTMAMATTTSERQLRKIAHPFLRNGEGYRYSGAEIQHDFEDTREAYEAVRGEMTAWGVDDSNYMDLVRLGYAGSSLMLRLNRLAQEEVSTTLDPDAATFTTEESIKARNAGRLATLMSTLGPNPRGGRARLYICDDNVRFVSDVDRDTVLSEELLDLEAVESANARYGQAQADFHGTFKRIPTEEERQRYMQEDAEVVRARKIQLSRLNMTTGVHQALAEEVADLNAGAVPISVMSDQNFLIFVSRLYPVLKGLSDAGLEPGLEDLLGERITYTRDPKRRPIIQAHEVRDAVRASVDEAAGEAWLEEFVPTIAPGPVAAPVRAARSRRGSRVPAATRPGIAGV